MGEAGRVLESIKGQGGEKLGRGIMGDGKAVGESGSSGNGTCQVLFFSRRPTCTAGGLQKYKI